MEKKSNLKKSSLKKFLATASAFAVIAGAANQAQAVDTVARNPAAASVLSNGGHWRTAVGNNTAPVVGANNNIFLVVDQDINFDQVIGNLGTLYSYGHNKTVTVTHLNPLQGVSNDVLQATVDAVTAANGGAVAAGGVGAAGRLAFNVNGALAQEFLGDGVADAHGNITTNTLSGLGNVTLSDDLAKLKLSGSNVSLGGTIDGKAAGQGIVEVNATNVQFAGVIGGTKGVQQLKLNAGKRAILKANAKFDDTVGAGGIEIGNASILTVDNGVSITTNDTNANALSIDAANANNGTLILQGASDVAIGIGTGAALNIVQINDGVVDFKGSANNGGGNLIANNFVLNHANAVMKLSTVDHKIVGNIIATNPNQGKVLIFGANNHEIIGNIGDVNNAINEIRFDAAANAQTLTIKGALIHTANGVVSDTLGVNGGGKIDIQSDALSLNSNFGTDAKHLNEFKITSNTANNGAATVTLEAGKSIFTNKFISAAGQANIFIMKAGSSVKTFGPDALKLENAGSILRFAEDDTKIDGEVKSSGAGPTGKIEVEGNAIITGNAGTGVGVDRLDSISFITNDEKTLQVGGDVGTANGVIFAKNGTLEFTGAKAHALTGNVLIGAAGAGVAGGSGTIRIAADVGANAVEFTGQIGDNTDAKKLLNLLEIGANSTAQFTTNANVHINTVKLLGDGVVELSAANGGYKIGEFENISDNGTLKISQDDVTLLGRAAPADAAINFGTSDARLKEFVMNGNRTLNIGDGVNIHANKFTANGANQGKLVFEGISIFEMGELNANGTLSTITLEANANVTIASLNTLVNGATTLGDKSTLLLQGNYTGDIDAANVDNGTLKFTNPKAATLTGKVGNAAALASIEFEGADVTFAGDVENTNKAFVFGGKDDGAARKITFTAGTDLGNSTFTNNRTVTDTIVLTKANNTFTKNLATDITKQLNFQLSDGKNVEITDGNATGTNFTTSTDGKGELKLNKEDLVINSAGADGKSLAKVEFTKSATISNNLYSSKVIVNAAQTATLGGTIKSGDFGLEAADSKVIFADNAIVDSVIKAKVGGQGLVEFAGGAVIKEDLGTSAHALSTVTFADAADKVVKLGADVYATNTQIRQSAIELTKDVVKISGNTSIDNASMDLDNKTFQLKDVRVSGINNLKFNVIDKGDDDLAGGNIVISGDATFEKDSKIVIDPDDNSSIPTGGNTRIFELIKYKGKLTNRDNLKIEIADKDKFAVWEFSKHDDRALTLSQKDNFANELKKRLGSKLDATDKSNIDAFANASKGTDGNKFRNLLIALSYESSDQVDEAIKRLTSQTTVTATLEDSVSSVGQSLGERAMSLSGNQGTPVETRVVGSENISGVAAGEEQARFGAWFSPFFNKTTQKARKGAAGYKSEAYGASFGFDTRANDDMIIGAAITASNSELKHKNFKSGDKTKVNSLLFSIYGMQQITDNWFAHGSATFGTNEVKKSSKRKAKNGYEVANGKYNSMSFSSDVMFGYNYVTEQATLTPMAGFRYSRVNDGGHKESGTSFQNLDVTNKVSNKFEVVVGARASGGTFDLNGVTVTPEVHGFINYDLINKASKSSIKLGSTNLTAKSSKSARASYNLGLGANAEYGMMEYGASYDAQLADKRVGHQGTLRLRVNF